MKVELRQVGKRYRFEWIIRDLDLSLDPTEQYAITGPNGSGKSTLLKILSGHLTPSKGKISFFLHGKPVPIAGVFQHLSYAAPYIELIEELNLEEAIDFHLRFKPLLPGLDRNALIDRLDLGPSRKKQLRNFSSGMKQRVKLALAVCSDTALLLLDEPTTNLDRQGVQWYRELIADYGRNRLAVIASNVEEDIDFCSQRIHIMDYKKKRIGDKG